MTTQPLPPPRGSKSFAVSLSAEALALVSGQAHRYDMDIDELLSHAVVVVERLATAGEGVSGDVRLLPDTTRKVYLDFPTRELSEVKAERDAARREVTRLRAVAGWLGGALAVAVLVLVVVIATLV
ncbi:MAG TPA: hypothetical protein VFT95_13365 [Micromonosporaceae bacterium]|nr:hypothetical protein [Micromonosporaceae bacterium]